MAADGEPPFADGFRPPEDEPDAPYLIFSERLGDTPGIFYIHGALHYYLVSGELRKHSWIRSGGQRLTELIREGLDAGQYPLFVAEGDSEKKLAQIQRHGYLWYCLDKFSRIETPLIVYGHSLGPSDEHLVHAIAGAPRLKKVFIGLHGNPTSEKNQEIIAVGSRIAAARERLRARRRSAKPLEVHYYQSETARIWE
jgi:hypothetical protein